MYNKPKKILRKGDKVMGILEFINEVKAVIDDYMDYYNNERGQWKLAKLTPAEYYKYRITGKYPLDSDNECAD